MTDSQIFDSVGDALELASYNRKPVLAYTRKSDSLSPMLNEDNMAFIKLNFVAVDVTEPSQVKLLGSIIGEVIIPYVYVIVPKSTGFEVVSIPQMTPGQFKLRLTGLIDKFKKSELSPDSRSTHSDTPRKESKECLLSFRLLDGSTIQHKFSGDSSLDEVRLWLDSESGIEVITSVPLPSFATPDALQPVRYAFQSPTLPRITYEKEDEEKTLAELGLCPRSVVILKPIFDETAAINYSKRLKLLEACKSAVGSFGSVIYSFFNYGTDLETLDTQEEEEEVKSTTKLLTIDKKNPKDGLMNIERKDSFEEKDKREEAEAEQPEPVISGEYKERFQQKHDFPSATRIQTIPGDKATESTDHQ